MSLRNWEDRLELGPQCYERYLNQQYLPQLEALSVALAGISQLRGHYCVARKKPDYHTILFTLEGSGHLETPVGIHSIPGNSITVLPAAQPFEFSLHTEHWATAWFCLEDTPLWQHLKRMSASIRFTENASPLYYLLGHLYYEHDPAMHSAPIQQLQRYLKRELGEEFDQQKQSEPVKRLQQLFADVQEQLHVNWTVQDMADQVHYSQPHLHRLCNQVFGRSPLQQLIYLRMERAKQLLSDTNWSLIHIASALGYSDLFNFSNRFKKTTGVAPSIYRLEHRKK